MNEQQAERPPLPELSDERIDEMERALFAGIDSERRAAWRAQAQHTDRRRLKRRRVIGWGSAAAIVVIAAVAIGPVIASTVTRGSAGSSSLGLVAPPAQGRGVPAPDTGSTGSGTTGSGKSPDGSGSARQIVATAQATVQVDDVAAAARTIAAAAQKRGGYVESMNVGGNGTPVPTPEATPGVAESSVAQGGTITVRVPAAQLTAAISALSAVGTVQASSISQQDVTTQAIDLRAQIDALQASVTRLTELMRKSGTVADLIAAESALEQRQADLESARQQLATLSNQVSLSSLTVTLLLKPTPAQAAPAGFGDGFTAGWNGLVAVVDGIIIGIGFLLPWLVIAVVVAAIVWGILRWRHRRRSRVQAVVPADED
ncbi:MAG TPA: DUF4349 domain-containing protein [Microbacterium sp.]|uniref:DUF4349 domain-containing protein n=1 Tax=Microbacterium sp. TaxID=51671 RepID=UPI002B47DFF1|nr:DUF4349 domain-containing protein [Microbacterium sp.]HKT58255.1 DUF4349 domain-containing protein [Microbacterium sp.]